MKHSYKTSNEPRAVASNPNGWLINVIYISITSINFDFQQLQNIWFIIQSANWLWIGLVVFTRINRTIYTPTLYFTPHLIVRLEFKQMKHILVNSEKRELVSNPSITHHQQHQHQDRLHGPAGCGCTRKHKLKMWKYKKDDEKALHNEWLESTQDTQHNWTNGQETRWWWVEILNERYANRN